MGKMLLTLFVVGRRGSALDAGGGADSAAQANYSWCSNPRRENEDDCACVTQRNVR